AGFHYLDFVYLSIKELFFFCICLKPSHPLPPKFLLFSTSGSSYMNAKREVEYEHEDQTTQHITSFPRSCSCSLWR
ncbi:hypothetical protein ACHAWF_002510, partial [Thalassiosira exigua]